MLRSYLKVLLKELSHWESSFCKTFKFPELKVPTFSHITFDNVTLLAYGITLGLSHQYFQCEVSKAEFDQKQKAKEFIQSQMALPPGAIQQVLNQGQHRSTQSQGQQRPISSQGQQRSAPGQGQQKSGQSQTQGQQRPGSSQGQQRPGSSQGQRKRDVRGQKVTDQGQQRSTPGQGECPDLALNTLNVFGTCIFKL